MVYSRITKFLNGDNLIQLFLFGFRQNYSTNHALINLTEDIRKNLVECKAGLGIFVDLQESFDTFDHNVLLANLYYYGHRHGHIIIDIVLQTTGLNLIFLSEHKFTLSMNSILMLKF